MITRKNILIVISLLLGLWLGWKAVSTFSRSYQTQVLDAQEELLRAVERRDWEAVKSFLTDDYMDEAGQDRDLAVDHGRQALAHFFTLTISHEVTKVQAVHNLGMVHCHIKLEGNGAGYSQTVLSTVNNLKEPWVFHWHKKGRWPWNWKVVQIHQDQIAARAQTIEGFK